MGADFGALLDHDYGFSGASCLSRMAAASPAGPAPTITASNSIASRGGSSGVFMAALRVPDDCFMLSRARIDLAQRL